MSKNRLIVLEDAISEVGINVEKARAVVSEICEGYFYNHTDKTQSGRNAIAWDFNHYRILNDIVLDILFEINKVVETVKNGEVKDHEQAG